MKKDKSNILNMNKALSNKLGYDDLLEMLIVQKETIDDLFDRIEALESELLSIKAQRLTARPRGLASSFIIFLLGSLLLLSLMMLVVASV